ncbi:methyltransferase [Brevibacterium aurantiacum]|uniref:Class I SAM-dependent methyltransferase n=1 Tax=Brevibacterium aurantiacum TaxID=273384 RepID=A0A556CMK0_BREAU|nr:class I SAM-dependent methyltransferase [Brevibacterium aurantiacum]TSI18664.1 class I SAM-dependent methyltransferase [Brevibacterium aurantiacum]
MTEPGSSATALGWTEDGAQRSATWHSENQSAAPAQVTVISDDIAADAAYRLARSGTGLLWRGDYHNGRQLLQAMDRRFKRHSARHGGGKHGAGKRAGRKLGNPGGGDAGGPSDAGGPGGAAAFQAQRRYIAQRARLLGALIVELDGDYLLNLRRAPDVSLACEAAYGPSTGPMCVSLTELNGVLSAYQWQLKGVAIPALGEDIHPRYGVFSPIRGEYVDLVAQTPFPESGTGSSSAPKSPTSTSSAPKTAFDLGTGTGVLAAVLLRRGVERVVATDINPRAVTCAQENLDRLGLASSAEVVKADLFPQGRADLIVCNPPWLPARPTSALEAGIYDPGSDVLHRFIDGLAAHLSPSGEGWLILSDLAERLGLRTREELLERITAARLRVHDRHDTTPRHPRASDPGDELHRARSAEVTSLWRIRLSD